MCPPARDTGLEIGGAMAAYCRQTDGWWAVSALQMYLLWPEPKFDGAGIPYTVMDFWTLCKCWMKANVAPAPL